MNCANLRKLIDKSNEIAAKKIMSEKVYVVNMKIWVVDNYNVTACKRLAQYFIFNDNLSEAKRMYMKALEIYPNDRGLRRNFNEIIRIQAESEFIGNLTSSNECYNLGRKLTQQGLHWLARGCYFKAYSLEPSLKYGISLAKSYSKLGNYDKMKILYKELRNNNPSHEIIEDIEFEFMELLKGKRNIRKKQLTA